MKELIYKGVGSVMLTDSEFELAKLSFIAGTNYFCKRTNDILSPFFTITKSRELEERFKTLVYIGKESGIEKRVLYDFSNDRFYTLPKGLSFDAAYENIIKRENGEDVPSYGLTPIDITEKNKKELFDIAVSEDEFIDRKNRGTDKFSGAISSSQEPRGEVLDQKMIDSTTQG